MKKLDVRKEYRDSKIELTCGEDYTGILLRSPLVSCYFDIKINLGEGCSTTLAQANAILKAMGLDYELYESTDWHKVEEGTNVLVLDKNGIIDGYRGRFVKYIADIKKIVVRNILKPSIPKQSPYATKSRTPP